MRIQRAAGQMPQAEMKSVEGKAPIKEIQSSQGQTTGNEAESKQLSEAEIIKAIEGANKALVQHSTELAFSIHEKTKQIIVKVLDKETGEVVREIPNEKILDLVAKMVELAGIFVDERR